MPFSPTCQVYMLNIWKDPVSVEKQMDLKNKDGGRLDSSPLYLQQMPEIAVLVHQDPMLCFAHCAPGFRLWKKSEELIVELTGLWPASLH